MIKIFFALLTFYNILALLRVVTGQKTRIESANKTIEQIEHINRFSNINFTLLCRVILLIVTLIEFAIVGATVPLIAAAGVMTLAVPAILLSFELYDLFVFNSFKDMAEYMRFGRDINIWYLFFKRMIWLMWSTAVFFLL